MFSRKILWNAATTIAQVIVSAASLFVLYRFLIRSLGVELLGVWSLVLATTSVVTLANQGFSTSIVKFVAQYSARDEKENTKRLIETALITVALFVGIVCIALYPAARWALHLVMPPSRLADAYAILPYSLVTLWINILGSVLLAALAGHELITHRNYVVGSGSIFYLVLAFLFVPGRGLLGLAFAQTAQTVACYLATWILLKKQIPSLPFVPRHWNRTLFREMGGYGLHFQFITTAQAAREPVTKALLAKFGGLAMTGYYDMASRWVFTFRELIVQANLVLVPTIAGLRERSPESIPAIYRQSYKTIFLLAFPVFGFAAAASPIVSRIWIGRYQPVFVSFVVLLAAGWLINVLSNPAYVVDLGTGALLWVSIGCGITSVLNPLLGFVAGLRYGGTAVVAASVVSLILGYLTVLIAYHVQNSVPFPDLLPKSGGAVVLACAVGTGLSLLATTRMGHVARESQAALTTTTVGACGILIAPMWLHPWRKRASEWLFSNFLPGGQRE